jgi:hypothetical protein
MRINHFFESIACHYYAERLGIDVSNKSRIIQIEGNSFRALSAWRHSRSFTCVQNKHHYCVFDDQNFGFARAQIRVLLNFLSIPFPTRPFAAVDLCDASTVSPAEIVQFIGFIDQAGCSFASISSGLSRPEWFKSFPSKRSRFPVASLSHLQSLDIDHQYLSNQQWSALLTMLMGETLEALLIRGRPTIRALHKFLSRNLNINRFEFNPCWGSHNRCIKSSGLPQNTLHMPVLSQIEGPPCHLHAFLTCLSHVPDALSIRVRSDQGIATYLRYVRAILRLASMCGPHVHLDVHLLPRYLLEDNLQLGQAHLESLTAIVLPEEISLSIFFPSMSERLILVWSLFGAGIC